MIANLTSLHEIGFRFFYDDQHKYEVKPGDAFDAIPSKTLQLYFGMRPYQKEDGKWYTKEVYPTGIFPHIFFGVYTRSLAFNNIFIGKQNDDTAPGISISEISIWKKKKDNIFMQKLFTDRKIMISDSEGLYSDIASAEADGLSTHFEFSDTLMTTRNFNNNNILASKSVYLGLASDELHSGNKLTLPGSSISITGENVFSEFSFNVRFQILEYKDCVIYEDSFFRLSFDSNLVEFILLFNKPLSIVSVSIPFSDLKLNTWESIGFSFSNGQVQPFLSGRVLNVSIVGHTSDIYKYQLETKNIESYTCINRHLPLVSSMHDIADLGYPPTQQKREDYIKAHLNVDHIHLAKQAALFSDEAQPINIDNFSSMIYDSLSKGTVIATGAVSTVIDDEAQTELKVKVPHKLSTYIRRYKYYRTYGEEVLIVGPSFSIDRNSKKVSFQMEVDLHSISWSSYSHSYYTDRQAVDLRLTTVEQRISGQISKSVAVTINYSDQLSESEQTFPMIWMFPGAELVVREVEIVLPES